MDNKWIHGYNTIEKLFAVVCSTCLPSLYIEFLDTRINMCFNITVLFIYFIFMLYRIS